MRNLIALGLMFAAPVVWTTSAQEVLAQDAIKSERVSFKRGQSSTLITRTIRGRETIDFLVNAREGQELAVSMSSNNTAAYFNVIEPGQTNEAVYVGSMSSPANSVRWTIQKSGDLRVRVYLYRNAARRGERANIRLNISVTGSGSVATQLPGSAPGGGIASHLPGDALVPGTHYHATGRVSCIARTNGPVGDCQFGVVRLGGGSASVTITKLDGLTRTIVYHQGSPVGFDQGPRDPGRLTWTREGYQTTIQIGGERYYIPDAVVFGG